MEAHEDQSHYVKRVVLPSGKTIEVVYFRDGGEPAGELAPGSIQAEPYQELHVCEVCDSSLVYPVDWDEAGPESWSVVLECPNCLHEREGVFSQENVENFDEQLDAGADALARDYKRLMRLNMAEEIDRFVRALEADAILPVDF